MSAVDIQKSIMKAVDTIAMRRIEQLKLDKTITAIIDSPVGVVNNKKVYKVEYEGGFFNATAQNTNDAYLPKMAVYVSVPEGDFSKEKFILGRASSATTNEQKTVVAAIANNFSIVGKSLVNKNNQVFGVRSYHDPKTEILSENTIKGIDHRYNFLYGYQNNKISLNENDLTKYKNDATAIMIRANFMTRLTQEQREQANGEYGLVFNLRFKNLMADIGETQGEIFNYYAATIRQGDGTTLLQKDKKVGETLKNSNFRGQDKALDSLLNESEALVTLYQQNYPAKYTTEMKNIVNGYLQNLRDMIYANSDADARVFYDNWKNDVIGEPAEKTVSYFLSSDKMIGNPFFFTSWMNQYAIFEIDLDNFLGIDSVLFYKDGFVINEAKDNEWEEDILVKDIQFYMMKPVADFNGQYQLKVESLDGFSFKDTNSSSKITLEASLLREYYEDLTLNADTAFFWFKQDQNVTSPTSDSYHVYGGIGWARIDTNGSNKLTITGADNKGYENHYRCAVSYKGEDTPVLLRYDLVIYNDTGEKFVIESNLGDVFGFDSGVPTLTVYKQNPSTKVNTELVNNNLYRFYWTIIDGNGQQSFLDQKIESLNFQNISVGNYLKYTNTSKLLNGITFYKGDSKITDTDDKSLATRITYPMSNVGTASSVIFEVFVAKRNSTSDNNFYSIGKAILKLANQIADNINNYRVYIENGDQVFQYDEYGNSPTTGKFKDPQDILPIAAHLFSPNNLEIKNTNFRVKWYMPTRPSMIQYTNAKKDPATGLNNLYEDNQIAFTISDLYDYNAFDNQIICEITYGQKVIRAETSFFFGKVGENGTNGTDMVAKIISKTEDILYQNQPLSIIKTNNAVFWNSDDRPTDSSATSELVITNGINNGKLIPKLYQKSKEVAISNVKWNIAGNTSNSSNKIGRDFVLNQNKISWNGTNNNTNKYRQYILKAEIVYENKTYYAFYSLPVIDYNGKYTQVPVLSKNRIGINVKTYLKDILYNADGRNPLYNHNQGVELVNVPNNYKVKWSACGGYTDNEEDTESNTPMFKLLPKKDSRKTEAVKSIEAFFKDMQMVYILPEDSISGNITNNYVKAEIWNENNLIATVYAPINMTLNTFGLASVNAWDGNSITIDNERGAVLAPQIAAGEKDTNNRFTGVVMGKTETATGGGEKEKQMGLFGYAHGLQSIFLDAETGNATFGLPEGKVLEGIIPKNNDNYNEGRIELRPGNISSIGGWRLGRRSLYYTVSKAIGPKYSADYIPNASGKIVPSQSYNAHHEKDIAESDQGILLHSGTAPYISVKGKQLDKERDGLSKNSASYLENTDSLEIQLDPQTPTLFTIFRHNGVARYKDANKTKIMYEKDSRTFLAGINGRGELVANAVQNVTKPSSTTAGDITVRSSVNTLPAFGETIDNASHIGFSAEAGDDTIVKLFTKNNGENSSTLYISGSGSLSNEYIRPLSLHGKSISLYASSLSSVKTTTNSYIKIDTSSLQMGVENTSNTSGCCLKLFNSDKSSLLHTKGAFEINVGESSTGDGQDFSLISKSQKFESNGNIFIEAIKEGNINIKTIKGNITIGAQTNLDIYSNGPMNLWTHQDDIVIQRGTTANKQPSQITLQDTAAEMRADNGTRITLRTEKDEGASEWRADRNIELYSSNTDTYSQIALIVDGAAPGISLAGNMGQSSNQIFLQAGTTTLGLTSSDTDFSGFNSGSGYPTGYPMYLDFGTTIGRLDVSVTNYEGETDIHPMFYVGMNQQISRGLHINGTYDGGIEEFGLEIEKNAHIQGGLQIDGILSQEYGVNEGAMNGLWVNYDAHVGGSLGINGNEYLSGGLEITGAIIRDGGAYNGLWVDSNAHIGGSLGVDSVIYATTLETTEDIKCNNIIIEPRSKWGSPGGAVYASTSVNAGTDVTAKGQVLADGQVYSEEKIKTAGDFYWSDSVSGSTSFDYGGYPQTYSASGWNVQEYIQSVLDGIGWLGWYIDQVRDLAQTAQTTANNAWDKADDAQNNRVSIDTFNTHVYNYDHHVHRLSITKSSVGKNNEDVVTDVGYWVHPTIAE